MEGIGEEGPQGGAEEQPSKPDPESKVFGVFQTVPQSEDQSANFEQLDGNVIKTVLISPEKEAKIGEQEPRA